VRFVIPDSHGVAKAISPWRKPWEHEQTNTRKPRRGDRCDNNNVWNTSDMIAGNNIRCRPYRGLGASERPQTHGSRRGNTIHQTTISPGTGDR